MANLINEAKRMQQLAGILNESQLNEIETRTYDLRDILKNKHVNDNKSNDISVFKVGMDVLPSRYYKSMDEIRTELGKVTKISGNKVFYKTFDIEAGFGFSGNKGEERSAEPQDLIIATGLTTESQELNEMLPKDIKIGELYIASMPTSNDGKERIDVKVKVVGPAKELSDTHFVVEPIESKRFINPVSKGENEFSKGKQYNIEAMYLKPATQAESLDIEEVVNEALKAVRK